MNQYNDFLESKKVISFASGIDIHADSINPILYPFQVAVTKWAVEKGRSAIFADCGLGKTFMQLEWARTIREQIGGAVLIFAPLSVSGQTISEAAKLGITVQYAESPPTEDGIWITNYDRASKFKDWEPSAIVLDESSILKSVDGKTRKLLIESFQSVPYRLCCTATPCPNDIAEIANHAHFLGVMTRQEMLGAFFVHDQDGWRLRGHAREPFFRWLASWAMAVKKPSDIGFSDEGYDLPKLTIQDCTVETEWRAEGHLFPGELGGITGRAKVRKASVSDRVAEAVKVALNQPGQGIIWCGLNDESSQVSAAIADAVEVHGGQSNEKKLAAIEAFMSGEKRVLVSKPKITGFGMNFQNADWMVFLGLSDSYEAYYQCIRRVWRFGQPNPVNVFIVVTDHEHEIVSNVRHKEQEAERLSLEIISAARKYEMEELRTSTEKDLEYSANTVRGDGWTMVNGDSVEEMKNIPDESVDLSVFSPPFLALYTYSESERDMGNSTTEEQFFEHFAYIIDELYRITKPGRHVCVHAANVAATLSHDGFIGMKNFRGRLVDEFVKRSWHYHGEVTIDKDPQAQAIRTHAKGLLFVQLKKDSSWMRPAMADYIIIMRKPGDNAVPVHPDISNNEWIEWARPIWYNIRESNTLNTGEAKSHKDDRHICPLQLETIERCIRLWTNPGEMVFSPFAGIGSEGHEAVRLGREFIGIELKELYAETAVRNIRRAKQEIGQPTLFGVADAD